MANVLGTIVNNDLGTGTIFTSIFTIFGGTFAAIGPLPIQTGVRRGLNVLVKQNSSVHIRVLMRSNSSGLGLAGLSSSLTIKESVSGTSSFTTVTPTITDIGNGFYDLALTSTHTGTLGAADFYCTAPNAVPNGDLSIQVVAFDPTDANALGLGTITLPTGAVVTNGSNTSTAFQTNLTSTTTDYVKDAYIVFTSGALIQQVSKILGYNGSTFFITVGVALTGTPSGGDTFYIINR